MQNNSIKAAIAAGCFVIAGSAWAVPYNTFDPRSMGMGGAGVAAGTSANAVFLNPSLLALKRNRDKFSLDFPVGARLADPNNLMDAVNQFKDSNPITAFKNAIDAYAADNSPANQAAVESTGTALIDDLHDISGKTLQAEGAGAIVVGVPGDSFGFSVFANAYVVGGTLTDVTSSDISAIQQVIDAANSGGTVTDPTAALTSSVAARFATVAESGVGLAHRFDSLGGIAVGLTPKFVQVTTYDYTFTGSGLDNAKIDLDTGKTTQSNFNMDLGLAKDFNNGWLTGLSVRNLFAKDYETVQHNIFRIEPQARLGLAYRHEWMTVATDVDLTENKPAGFESKTRYAIVGGEFDVVHLFQLRLGYRRNLATLPPGQEANVFSAGIGLSPLGVHLDAAVAGNSDEIGGSLQVGMQF